MAAKNSLKDKLEDDELDLSMMQYTDVPVKEIEQLGPKVLTVNLSHNLLSYLPPTFPFLTHLTKLDLSKNQLVELPENFGQLKSLRSLDLYANQLVKLPVSFSQLKNLKWLDLKDNPLCPAVKQAAGDCITPNDCALCAKKVVALLQSMESQLQRERQRLMEEENKRLREKERLEEMERERLRQEKRAAKEKRREENKLREEDRKKDSDQKIRHEMQLNGTNGNSYNGTRDNGGKNRMNNNISGEGDYSGQGGVSSCLGSLVMFLLGVCVVGVGLAMSLIWIYTEGRLDSKSVSAALPVIQSDVEDYLMTMGQKTVIMYEKAEKVTYPYVERALISGQSAWKEGGRYLRQGAKYMETNHGDTIASIWEVMKSGVTFVWKQMLILWKIVLPYLSQAWEMSRPFFHNLGKVIIEICMEVSQFLHAYFPVCIDYMYEIGGVIVNTWQKIVEAF